MYAKVLKNVADPAVEEVKEASFGKVLKYNPNHGPDGKFTSGTGGSTAHGRKTLRGLTGHAGDFPHDDRPIPEVVAAIKSHLSPEQLAAAEAYDKANEEGIANHQDSISKYAKVIGTASNGSPRYKWSPERAALHRKIIKEFFKDEQKFIPPEGVAPEFVALGGRGGSGKSFFTEDLEHTPIKNLEKYKVLDPDIIKKQLTGYDGTNARLYHDESSYLNDKILDMALYKGMNLVQDVTMKSLKGVKGALDTAHRRGYKLQGHYMHLPVEKAGVRAMARTLGKEKRYVPLDILAGMKDNERNFQTLVNKGYFHKWSTWTNDVPKGTLPKLVAKRGG